MSNWSMHLCGKLSWDKWCRDYGCARLHINTPWWFLTVALNPDARWIVGHPADGRTGWIELKRRK